MRRLIVVFALAGCDKIIGLQQPDEIDAAPNGHDEDLDGIADAADNCPTVKNKQTADADMDGVGDACDPHPGVVDHIAAFYGFDTDNADWARHRGQWDVMADHLLHVRSTDFGNITADHGMMFAPPYVVEARFRFGNDLPDRSELSIVGAIDAAYIGFYCTLTRTGTGAEVSTWRPGEEGVTQVKQLDVATTFTARLVVDTDMVSCDIKGDGAPGAAATVPIGASRTGPIGIEARYADVQTDFVIVYTHAP